MSKLLIQENPMMILPSLAEKIGLNQAIVIQQFHYWLVSSKHLLKGESGFITRIKSGNFNLSFGQEKQLNEQFVR